MMADEDATWDTFLKFAETMDKNKIRSLLTMVTLNMSHNSIKIDKVQKPLHTCAEPDKFRFDFEAA